MLLELVPLLLENEVPVLNILLLPLPPLLPRWDAPRSVALHLEWFVLIQPVGPYQS